MFQEMRTRSIQAAIGLMLAFFLAAAPAFCWDCCCSSSPAPAEPKAQTEAGHGCCPEPDASSEAWTVSAASGCKCPEIVNSPFEARRTPAATSTVESRNLEAAGLAVLSASSDVSRPWTGFEKNPVEPPLPVTSFSLSSLAPRAPPAHSS
jgi:hypothetical protein